MEGLKQAKDKLISQRKAARADRLGSQGRGPVRYLVRMSDDATSWHGGRFVERDATSYNMAVFWEYLEVATPAKLCEHTTNVSTHPQNRTFYFGPQGALLSRAR